MDKIKLGISTCLLGEKVRYDGQHKLDHYLTDTLGQFVEYVPVCPEVECGLPIPREAMHLSGDPANPRLVTINTGKDITPQMEKWIGPKLDELAKEKLCGYVFKSKSPSSGMERVKVFNAKGVPAKIGVGIFAAAFMKRFPLLPVEEEGRLHDPNLRNNFIDKIAVYARWQEFAAGPTAAELTKFHARHKYLIMAHHPALMRELGKLAASAGKNKLSEVMDEYFAKLMQALSSVASNRKNTDVLHHILGYFKKSLTAAEKAETIELIEAYHKGDFPLLAPLVMLRHYARKYNQKYLLEQYYLCPTPMEMQLKYHV